MEELEIEEIMCPSLSPHGNPCDFVINHEGWHQIEHMMGSEAWDDDGVIRSYYLAT